jgi:Protein phosphatase 2C
MMPRTPGPGESRPGRPGDPAARGRNQAGGTLRDLTPLGKVIFIAAVISLTCIVLGWNMFGKRGLIVGAAAFALTASVAASWRAARQIVRHHDASPGGQDGPEARATTVQQMPAGQPDVPPRDAGPFPAEPGACTTALREPPGSREPASAPAAGLFPVIHQRSRLATAPWRLPASASPPGLAADQGTIGSLDVRAASLVGPAHRHTVPALPRQDAYRLGQDTCRGHLIVAVADGMSDSKHSDAGANVAAAAAVGEIRARLDRGLALEQLDASDIFAVAAGQMIGAADQRGWSHDDVRSALAVAVIPAVADVRGDRRAWLAALADVNVWRWQPDGWERLLGDLKDGLDASMLAHYLPYHPEDSASRLVGLRPGDVLAITTDGVGDAIGTLPGAAAWFARRWREPPDILSFAGDVGYGDIQFNDDRTAVVVWCSDRRPGR